MNTLLLDKTGTITLGNRQASEFLPMPGVSEADLADAAQLSSLTDETPEGRSVVVLAKERYGLRERHPGELTHATFVPFTAQTRMSGVDLAENGETRQVRKGAASSVVEWIRAAGGSIPTELGPLVDGISAAGGTPLVVAANDAPRRSRARRDSPQGHRQARHARAVRRAARDGHSHGDDHRRQPADREGDRRGGRRRRLPRRGHA